MTEQQQSSRLDTPKRLTRLRWFALGFLTCLVIGFGIRLYASLKDAALEIPDDRRIRRSGLSHRDVISCLVAFKERVERGAEPPPARVDSHATIWHHGGNVFYTIGNSNYVEAVCKVNRELRIGSETSYGNVAWMRKLEEGYYWVVIQS